MKSKKMVSEEDSALLNCIECHYRIIREWGYTSHGKAFYDLKAGEFFFCSTCHNNQGYKEHSYILPLSIMQCECCHGAGEEHKNKPSKDNIIKTREKVCASCHNKLQDKMDLKNDYAQKSFHHIRFQEDKILKTRLREYFKGPSSNEKEFKGLKLDLFVMSMCPFGMLAEEKIFPLIKEYGDILDLAIYYVADDTNAKIDTLKKKTKEIESDKVIEAYKGNIPFNMCQAETYNHDNEDEKDLRFRSLHGKSEVLEDMRQLVIMKYYPAKWMDYILQRNQSLKNHEIDNWEDSAKIIGLDPELIKEKIVTEGEDLLAENLKASLQREVTASPILFINNRLYQERLDQFTLNKMISVFISNNQEAEEHRGIENNNRIACGHDSDCIVPSKVGRCINPDTIQSVCEFYDRKTFSVKIINDESNPVLKTTDYIKDLMRFGHKVSPLYIPYNTIEGIRFISQYNIKALPFILFDKAIKDIPFFTVISSNLNKIRDDYMLSQNLINPRYMIPGDVMPQSVEMFLEAGNLEEIAEIIPVTEELKKREQGIKYAFYTPIQNHISNAPPAVNAAPMPRAVSSDGRYVLEGSVASLDFDKSSGIKSKDSRYALEQVNISFANKEDIMDLGGQDETDETLTQICILKHFPDSYPEYIKYRMSSQNEAYSDTWKNIYTDERNEILDRCINSEEAEKYIKEHTERISDLGIKSFPAILFNNKILIEGNIEKYRPLLFDELKN